MSAPFTLSVPDMSCGHCRASITAALAPLGASPAFDAENRRVTISAGPTADAAIAALEAIGFSARKV